MKKIILSIVFVSLGLLVLWGCGGKKEEKAKAKPPAKAKAAVVAKIGNDVITAEAFKQEMMRRGGFYPERLDKKSILNNMIKENALFIKAKQLGLDKDPDVQRRYRNILISKLREKEISQHLAGMKLTEEELQAAYTKNIKRYTIPERVRLAEILIKTEPGIPNSQVAALKKRLEQCRKKALAQKEPGQGFGKLAVEFSQDAFSRNRGGDLGWFEAGRIYPRLEPAVLAAGFALKTPGQISDIIATEKGIYLVKLMDRRPEQVIPFSNVQGRIRQEILAQKRIALEKNFTDDILKSMKIETFPKVIDAIKLPAAPKRPVMSPQGAMRGFPSGQNFRPQPMNTPHPPVGMQVPKPRAPEAPQMMQKQQQAQPAAEKKGPAGAKTP